MEKKGGEAAELLNRIRDDPLTIPCGDWDYVDVLGDKVLFSDIIGVHMLSPNPIAVPLLKTMYQSFALLTKDSPYHPIYLTLAW